jgi:DnaK suppressor protein
MLSAHQLNTFRHMLHELRAGLDARLPSLRAEAFHSAGGEDTGEPSAAPTHLADVGDQELNAVVNVGLAANEANLRQEIDAALARLEDGHFGICEQCGREITRDRLEALPYAAMCIGCAEKNQ